VNVPKLSSKFYIARSNQEERERERVKKRKREKERERERERERESNAVLPSQSKIKLPKRSNIS
jgi:hypothetical protein